MADDGHRLKVIHAGAAEGAVGGRKPRRLDDGRLDPETSAQPQYRAGILRKVRLVKGKAQTELILYRLPQAGSHKLFRDKNAFGNRLKNLMAGLTGPWSLAT